MPENSKYLKTPPARPTYTQQADVVDYLSEDEEIPGQKFFLVSFVSVRHESQIQDFIEQVCKETGKDQDTVENIVRCWTELEYPQRADKVRGVFDDWDECCLAGEDLRNISGGTFDI